MDEDDFLTFQDMPGGSKRRRLAVSAGDRRRSSRTAAKTNINGKRESSSDSWSNWRVERRSTRLGGLDAQLDLDPPPKRARTVDSTNSAEISPVTVSNGTGNGIKLNPSGAAALKPTEIALEQIAGKKRSKFWVYAVEPVPQPGSDSAEPMQEDLPDEIASTGTNGFGGHACKKDGDEASPYGTGYNRSLEGSLSPLDS